MQRALNTPEAGATSDAGIQTHSISLSITAAPRAVNSIEARIGDTRIGVTGKY